MIRLVLGLALLLTACGDAGAASRTNSETHMSDDAFLCGGMDAREVLEHIKSMGADLASPREAVFYFYGSERDLPALQGELERLGFAVRATRTEPGRIATMDAVTNEAWLRDIMPKLCALTSRHGVEYDGWEASVPEAQRSH